MVYGVSLMELKQYPSNGRGEDAKCVTKKKRALEIVVLSIKPSLLYLIGDPQDPVVISDKLAAQFQKKK